MFWILLVLLCVVWCGEMHKVSMMFVILLVCFLSTIARGSKDIDSFVEGKNAAFPNPPRSLLLDDDGIPSGFGIVTYYTNSACTVSNNNQYMNALGICIQGQRPFILP